MFFGVFIAREVDEVADKGSGNTTMWCTDILGGLFKHVPEICLLHRQCIFW
jgi:hypothetical protein